MERDQENVYRYEGGAGQAYGGYAPYDGSDGQSAAAGAAAGHVNVHGSDNGAEHHHHPHASGQHLSPSVERDDDEGDESGTIRHGGGRPRDPIWAFFTDEPRCKYCNWKPDFPKAFRMRNHALGCGQTPQDIKEQIQVAVDERAKRTQERKDQGSSKPKKRKKGGSSKSGEGSTPSPKGLQLPTLHPAPHASTSGSAGNDAFNADDAAALAQSQQQQQQQQQQQHRPYHLGPGNSASPNSPVAGQQSHPYGIQNQHRYLPPFAHPHPQQHTPPIPMPRSPITCHVLDSTAGRPAVEMRIRLDMLDNTGFNLIGQGETDQDGRCSNLLDPSTKLQHGIFKITFYTSDYFTKKGILSFYPFVEIPFEIKSPDEHYHIPLLLSPYSYTTYRGS